MVDKRKICVVTGTRAEYGLLYMLMNHIKEDKALELQIIATGTHYSPHHGMTYNQIEKDGFQISYKIEMLLSNDSPIAVTKSLGLATLSFADAFDILKPDVLVVLGDRYEILAAAQAAMISRTPIVHLHGGEITEGLIDEAIRHSITKMAHLHFVATQDYANRVIQMGENPKHVYNYGAPGLDYIHTIKKLNRSELESVLNFKFQKLNFLVTYHPITLYEERYLDSAVNNFLKALSCYNDVGIIFTKPNAEVLGSKIINKIADYISNKQNCKLFDSLGQQNYYSLLEIVDVVIGNSSSGLIEAPVFNVPTVNIGHRQAGRSKGPSVIDADDSFESIKNSIDKALSAQFREKLNPKLSPYGIGGDSSFRIKECIKKIPLDGILMKKFHNIEFDTESQS